MTGEKVAMHSRMGAIPGAKPPETGPERQTTLFAKPRGCPWPPRAAQWVSADE